MTSPFAHTLRSLEVDGDRGSRALSLFTLLLIAAWLSWLFLARIPVTEASEDVRVQVDAAGYELAVVIEGRVLSVRGTVGAAVVAGEVIVELDDRETRQALELARKRIHSLAAVVDSLERQIAAERESIEAAERAAGAAAVEARARVDRTLAAARLADAEWAEITKLHEVDVATGAELRRSEAEAAQQRAVARELRSASARERFEQARGIGDRFVTIVRLEGQIAQLAVELGEARGELEALEAELDRHRIRAPVDGVIGELDSIERGSWLERGEIVGRIVPAGELEIVAWFEPSAAIGRVSVGQPATLRLNGFPWTQYGSIRAEVTQVASELRQGNIRVELKILAVPEAITLEHGLPGSVEVTIEDSSPVDLLLRAVGRRLTGTGAARGSWEESP